MLRSAGVVMLAATFLVAAFLSFATVPLFRWLALRHGFADRARPRQEGPLKPRLGGLALYLAFTLAILATLPLVEGRTVEELKKIISLLLGGTAVVAMGAWDDRRELGAWLQMGVQVAAACLALLGGIIIDAIANPLAAGPSESLLWLPIYASIPFTIVWLVGAMNAMNFIDGLDGLAGGMAVSGFSCFGIAAWLAGNNEMAVLNFTISGAALGFLYFNFPRARVFLGDSGAIPLGFLAMAMGLSGWQQDCWEMWFPLLVFSPFIVDATVTLIRRTLRGAKVTEAHREHYYQRAVQLGWSHRRVAYVEYTLMLAVGISSLVAVRQTCPWQTLTIWAAIYLVLLLTQDARWKKRPLN